MKHPIKIRLRTFLFLWYTGIIREKLYEEQTQ